MSSTGAIPRPSASATAFATVPGISGSSQATSRAARVTAASIRAMSNGTSVPSRRRTFAGQLTPTDFVA
ncbi:Uncharacterised protein [Mycobacterium tuberculosis]|uniref:Uncharacterized protein n=1 Tax=Mycobacterium tuberculosis TaxID=1773 RepID=A0A0U0S2F7_MYCTX|nr:Uncharacterised protein [Mycobacterium tuberculosis]COX42758.1 Uncharacterised protein [Mycobacterium tuberculosis]